jgi:protein translocase SecG subunit
VAYKLKESAGSTAFNGPAQVLIFKSPKKMYARKVSASSKLTQVTLMIVGLLYTLFVILSLLIIFIVLLQKSKGSLGLSGALGGQAQAMFGGSGGQDLFQKVTWGFIAAFMSGSLFLGILKTRSEKESRYFSGSRAQLILPEQPVQAPSADAAIPTEPSVPS